MTLAPEINLYSTVVKLVALEDGALPATQGRLAHAAFLDIMHAADPALARALHAGGGRRPFTVSPLRGLPRPQDGLAPVARGRTAWLRFTLLGGELYAAFMRRFLPPSPNPSPSPSPTRRGESDPPFPLREGGGGGRFLAGRDSPPSPAIRRDFVGGMGGLTRVRLGDVDFAVAEVLCTPGSHPWAGYTTLAALEAAWQDARPDEAARSIALRFASPTVFSGGTRGELGKRMDPFPAPGLLFNSLAAAWNAVSPRPVDKAAVRAYAEETVVVGLYRMASRMARLWGQPQIGAEGRVTYLLKDRRNPDMIRTLNVLADFAFYSGAGYKTTMGMGQVRRE
jgi:CRISPR-associated endoribonuclease Cas6